MNTKLISERYELRMLGRSLIRCAPALLLITASSILLAAPTAAPAAADAKPLDLPVVGPAIDCAALVSEDISTAVGAQVKIASATVVDDGKTAPFCRVQALIEDYAKFELHLPVSNWTQRFVAGSGPGSSQQTNGFVTMSRQDIGHRDDEDAFANNYQLRIDFAYRIVHLEVVAAKTLIARYYNQAPKFSYYNACSEPGREGMMEVQRFPDDFDGAVTGCPPINDTINNGLYEAWNIRTNTRPDGSLIITSDKLPILHQAVLGECDTLDGIKDGIISDPLNCHPKLTEVVCKPGQDTSSCLTTEQVHAALELYRGAHDDKGGKLEPIGVLPGSELQWVMVIAPNPPQPGRPRFANDREGTVLALRSEFSDPPLGTTWKLADLKFDRASFDAFTKTRYLYDATNPDLSAFAHAGTSSSSGRDSRIQMCCRPTSSFTTLPCRSRWAPTLLISSCVCICYLRLVTAAEETALRSGISSCPSSFGLSAALRRARFRARTSSSRPEAWQPSEEVGDKLLRLAVRVPRWKWDPVGRHKRRLQSQI